MRQLVDLLSWMQDILHTSSAAEQKNAAGDVSSRDSKQQRGSKGEDDEAADCKDSLQAVDKLLKSTSIAGDAQAKKDTPSVSKQVVSSGSSAEVAIPYTLEYLSSSSGGSSSSVHATPRVVIRFAVPPE